MLNALFQPHTPPYTRLFQLTPTLSGPWFALQRNRDPSRENVLARKQSLGTLHLAQPGRLPTFLTRLLVGGVSTVVMPLAAGTIAVRRVSPRVLRAWWRSGRRRRDVDLAL